MEGHDVTDPLWNDGRAALERNAAVVEREAVEARAMLAGKSLEMGERPVFVEGLDIAFERIGRIEDPCAAARGFLGVDRVRRAIGAEKEFGRPRGCGGADREAVMLAFGDGQTIGVRPDAADEHRIAVDMKMLRGDGCGDGRRRVGDELRRLCRGNMFKDDLERGQRLRQGREGSLDEHGLAIENIDLGVGDLAVDEQGHADRLHPLENRHDVRDIGDAVRASRGSMRGIELCCRKDTLVMAARQFVRVAPIGEIGDDERGEIELGGDRRTDSIPVGNALGDRRHRRREVRHHDRARELARGIGRDMRQHRAVAQMDVPVVGAADGEAVGHKEALGRS